MEIRVLWFEEHQQAINAANATMPQLDRANAHLVHVQTVQEVRDALAGEKCECAVIIHAHGSDAWRDVLAAFSAAPEPIPVVLLLADENEELSQEAVLSGAWHAVPRCHPELFVAALRRCLQHAAASKECSDTHLALRRAEAILEKNQRSMALGLLLGSIAHEINNPLEGMANLLFLAKHSLTDQEKLQKCLDMSEAELHRVSEITKQMLSFHRNSSAAQDVSLAELLDGVLSLFAAKLRERHILVQREYDTAGWMVGHSGELRQAFVNLIANAVDAMECRWTTHLASSRAERQIPSPLRLGRRLRKRYVT